MGGGGGKLRVDIELHTHLQVYTGGDMDTLRGVRFDLEYIDCVCIYTIIFDVEVNGLGLDCIQVLKGVWSLIPNSLRIFRSVL